MVRVRWKLEREKVYLELEVLGEAIYYWFPKKGTHKRFHPRQIFTRQINHQAYRDDLIGLWNKKDWIDGELKDKIVRNKLGITTLTWADILG